MSGSRKRESSALLTLIWLGCLSSPILFGAVVWLITRGDQSPGTLSFSDPLVAILSVLALLAFVAGSQLERFAGGMAERRSSGLPASRIIRYALFEGIGMIGLLLSIIKSDFLVYLPFMFLALAGLILSRPGERSTG